MDGVLNEGKHDVVYIHREAQPTQVVIAFQIADGEHDPGQRYKCIRHSDYCSWHRLPWICQEKRNDAGAAMKDSWP